MADDGGCFAFDGFPVEHVGGGGSVVVVLASSREREDFAQVPKAVGGGQPIPLIVGGVEKRDSLLVLTALCQSSGFESGKAYRADPSRMPA